MANIVLEGISKVFGTDVIAVNDVSLEIHDGEFMVLVGPSGCGKTTILRILAGLEEVTAGEVFIGERCVTDLPPKERDIAMVFQNYALYPHMTVEQNLGFGLRLRRMPKQERSRRVREVARTLGIESLLPRKPGALSGGQRQRVAMGRAMVREPLAFLMDEPLSNLDAKLRVQMRAELARLRDRLQATTIYVTHDQVEAMTLGDRVAVLNDGVLQQVDTPQRLFNDPANLFVAAFIGSPSMNLVEATVGEGVVSFAGFTLPLPSDVTATLARSQRVVLGMRPSDFQDADLWHAESRPIIEVVPDVVEDLGSEAHIIFRVDAPPLVTEQTVAASAGASDDHEEVLAALPIDEGRSIFTARVDARTEATPRRSVRLSVDPSRFYVFDPGTGRAMRTPGRARISA